MLIHDLFLFNGFMKRELISKLTLHSYQPLSASRTLVKFSDDFPESETRSL